MTPPLTAPHCKARLASIDAAIAGKRANFDEIAFAAVVDPDAAPIRDALRSEIETLQAERENVVAAARVAAQRDATARTLAKHKRHEEAYVRAERAVGACVEHAVKLEAVLIQAAGLFAAIGEADNAWRDALGSCGAGREEIERATFIPRFAAELSELESALVAAVPDIARLSERAQVRGQQLCGAIAVALTIHPTE